MDHKSLIQKQIEDSIAVKQQLLPRLSPSIESAGKLLVESLKQNGLLYFCGNGGSSCDASHIAAELVRHGANPYSVSKLIYETNSLERLRLLGFVLSEKLKVLPEFKTAYMMLTDEDLKRFAS